jgi:hypothetical protein
MALKTKTYDFRAFCQGELVKVKSGSGAWSRANDVMPVGNIAIGLVTGGTIAQYVSIAKAHADTLVHTAIPALTTGGPGAPVDIQHAFDPVITMLQQIAFPVASIVLAWACLQAMVGKPAAAVDRAKWAVLGYLAMRYAPEVLRHV